MKRKDIERKQEVLKGRENKKASTTRQSVLAKTIKKSFTWQRKKLVRKQERKRKY